MLQPPLSSVSDRNLTFSPTYDSAQSFIYALTKNTFC